ncbi:hypothetical protein AKJ16_DCAP27762 [Drosera capensis]
MAIVYFLWSFWEKCGAIADKIWFLWSFWDKSGAMADEVWFLGSFDVNYGDMAIRISRELQRPVKVIPLLAAYLWKAHMLHLVSRNAI